jgi:hypothetical protein
MSRNTSNDINCLLTSLCCCIFFFFLEVTADGTYNYQWNLTVILPDSIESSQLGPETIAISKLAI